MQDLFANATPLLMFLLPGFLSAWIFYGLTSYPKPTQFERTVEALVFTFVVHAATQGLRLAFGAVGRSWSLGAWNETSQLLTSVLLAMALGLALATAVNTDIFHAWLRRRGFTSRTSHPSEWFCVLDRAPAFVILQLKDGRRIIGWPKEWPVSPMVGQFYLQLPAWILDDGELVELSTLDGILIHATDVHWVEVFPPEENSNDQRSEGLKSTAARERQHEQAGTGCPANPAAESAASA